MKDYVFFITKWTGGHFDDNKNELVKESTKFWVDQVDGINLEDTLKNHLPNGLVHLTPKTEYIF